MVPILHNQETPNRLLFFILGMCFSGVQIRTEEFVNGAGQIWLDNVACTGQENRLRDCPASPFGTHNCNHEEDAGVRCSTEGESVE